MKVTAVVPAAGAGLRIARKKGPRKPFFIVKDKPILIHTLLALDRSRRISDIVVVVHRDDVKKWKRLIARFSLRKVHAVIPGGKTRFESVRQGLSHVPRSSDIVFIHDGVRPLIDKKMIEDAVRTCAKFGAAVCGVPVISTIKSVSGSLTVQATPDRKRLYVAQTPQVFKREMIEKAYRSYFRNTSRITDDSMLVERLGHTIKVVPGSYRNIKVTTPQDLILAEALMK